MGVIKANKDNFESEVLGSELPVLVDFWAEWCGPCRMFGPIVDQIAEEMEGKLKVAKVNVDEAQDLAAQYNVMSIPAIFIFNEGKIVNQMVGALSKIQLAERLAPHIKKD